MCQRINKNIYHNLNSSKFQERFVEITVLMNFVTNLSKTVQMNKINSRWCFQAWNNFFLCRIVLDWTWDQEGNQFKYCGVEMPLKIVWWNKSFNGNKRKIVYLNWKILNGSKIFQGEMVDSTCEKDIYSEDCLSCKTESPCCIDFFEHYIQYYAYLHQKYNRF